MINYKTLQLERKIFTSKIYIAFSMNGLDILLEYRTFHFNYPSMTIRRKLA